MLKNVWTSTQIPVLELVDQLTTLTRSSVCRNFSGNDGSNNVIGSHNTLIALGDGAKFGFGNQGGELGAGGAAPRPYRLIPYRRNSTFTGRENLIELVKRLSKEESHNRVALHGLGGSGKTQIALEYVYHRAHKSDCDVFWVQGSGVSKFSEDFRAVARHLRIPLGGAGTDQAGSLLGMKKWLEGPNSGDWVLVIDNADNEADFDTNDSPIAKFIPQGAKGTVIFTTRSRQVALRQGCELVEVGRMKEEEAEELFSKRYDGWGTLGDEEKKVVSMILGSVHHLPLAVVGSAAFMNETATPPSAYWSIFRENEERMRKLLLEKISDIQREVSVAESILDTYFVTFDRILQQEPLAAVLLRLMAFLDRQKIPEELLSQCDLEGMADPIQFRRAIGKLMGFSLVTRINCGDKIFYDLHYLVQMSFQAYLSTEDFNQGRATALRVISRFFPRDQDERRRTGPTYIPHALAVTRNLVGPIVEELDFRMGQYFLDLGSYNNAEIQFRRCIELREEGKEYDWDGEGHLRYMHLGLVKAYQGEYGESETMNRRMLEECEKGLGPSHHDTLTSVNNLAVVLRSQGRYDDSETMIRRALEGRKKVLGPDHHDTLTSLRNLAAVLADQGKRGESEKMNRHALERSEKIFGPDHHDTLTSLSCLAIVLASQGRFGESEAMNRRALEGREKFLGPDHPNTVKCLSYLAMALAGQAKYNESETMSRRALEGCEKVLGPDHPNTLTSVNNLAMVLASQGKYDKSETMNRRALEGREKVLGPDHPNTLTSLSCLAILFASQGRYDESEPMNRRALEGCQKVLGPDHPNTLTSVNNLAMVLGSQGKYEESETITRHALEGWKKVLGPDHPNTLTCLSYLASVLASQGKHRESEPMNRYALEGCEKVLGPDHPNTLTSVNNLAMVLASQGKYDESETITRRALEGCEKVLGHDHPNTLASLSCLAAVLAELERYDESERMNLRALEGYKKALGPDHRATLTCQRNLAVVKRKREKHGGFGAMNRQIGEEPRKPSWTSPPSVGRLIMGFLKTAVLGGGNGKAG